MLSNMDGAQSRVRNAVSTMVNTLDLECLRRMQVDMYHCNAKCCENSKATLEDVQKCIDDCSKDVVKAQSYLQSEIEIFQNRLQRCAMTCQDKLRDMLPTKPTDKDVEVGRETLEKCVIECAFSHVELVPGITKKMLETLKNKHV